MKTIRKNEKGLTLGLTRLRVAAYLQSVNRPVRSAGKSWGTEISLRCLHQSAQGLGSGKRLLR